MTFVPGAILYTGWGYEQTNREFFEIIRRSADLLDPNPGCQPGT